MPNVKLICPSITKILGRGPTNPSPSHEAICLAKRLVAWRVNSWWLGKISENYVWQRSCVSPLSKLKLKGFRLEGLICNELEIVLNELGLLKFVVHWVDSEWVYLLTNRSYQSLTLFNRERNAMNEEQKKAKLKQVFLLSLVTVKMNGFR